MPSEELSPSTSRAVPDAAPVLPERDSRQRLVPETIQINGRPHNVVLMTPDDLAFHPPEHLTGAEVERYQAVLEVMRQSAQILQRCSERLADPRDGATLGGVGTILQNRQYLSEQFLGQVGGYLLSILKNGSTLYNTTSSVLVPPCTRESFAAELSKIPEAVFSKADREAWIAHAYDSRPLVTQGYYLFASAADEERFHASLGKRYSELASEAAALFERATTGGLSKDDWRRYEHASEAMMEIQKQALEPALQADVESRALSTRVYISVDAQGRLSLVSRHFTDAFRNELHELHDKLMQAHDLVPAANTQLRGVLAAQAEWCALPSKDPSWGAARAEWIAAVNPAGILDINLCAEEKSSHLGAKGNFHLQVTQFDEVPAVSKPAWDAVSEKARASNVNTVLLRTLLSGGRLMYGGVLLGEKLPDPAGMPLYKSMTFRNSVERLTIGANAEAIAAATGLSLEEVGQLKDAPFLGTTFHEFGHTLGDHAAFLGAHGGSVEETNAQASAVYICARYAPNELLPLLRFETCWMPIRRIRQGATEQHSRSDITLLQEYLDAGAVAIQAKDGQPRLLLMDQDAAVATAFRTAIKMRLWEKGIPTRLQEQFFEPLSQTDPEQDARITARAVQFMSGRPDAETLRQETVADVNRYFAPEKLLATAHRVDSVIAHMPEAQPLAIIPTDQRIAVLVA